MTYYNKNKFQRVLMNYHTEIQKWKNISYTEGKYCHSNILWNAATLQK